MTVSAMFTGQSTASHVLLPLARASPTTLDLPAAQGVHVALSTWKTTTIPNESVDRETWHSQVVREGEHIINQLLEGESRMWRAVITR